VNRLVGFSIGLFVFSSPIAGFAQEDIEHTEYMFPTVIGKDAYSFQVIGRKLPIDENQKRHPNLIGKGVYSRSVHIDCMDKCKCEPHYVQQLENGGPVPWGGGPMAIIGISGNDDDQIMTTWSNGHVYSVTVYGCVDGKITAVLDRSSKTMPSFRLDDDGAPLVSLSKDEETAWPIVDLRWNGKTYVVRHTHNETMYGPRKGLKSRKQRR
jgi:hypothetical protein